MSSNPYSVRPVGTPYFDPECGGRGAHAERLRGGLARKTPLPDSISVLGERRAGKTSLLRYLGESLRGVPDLHLISIDMLALSPQTPVGFYKSLTRGLRRAGTLGADDEALTGPEAFQDLLMDLEERDEHMILLIDELDLVARDERFDREFFETLRSAATVQPLSLVVATSVPLVEVAHAEVRTSPFFNIFIVERLHALSDEESLRLIETPPEGRGVGEAGDAIRALAGRHPYFLQLACHEAWEIRRQDGTIDSLALRAAFEERAEPHFRYIWDRSAHPEQVVLSELARGEAPPESEALRSLQTRDYIVDDALFSESFARFVLRVAPPSPSVGVTPAQKSPLVPAKAAPEKRQVALVVGVDRYKHPMSGPLMLPTLSFAERDAEQVASHLEDDGFEVALLRGSDATMEAVEAAFRTFEEDTRDDLSGDSKFVFHFSGHGLLDPNDDESGFIALYETDTGDLTGTALSMEDLVFRQLVRVQLPTTISLLDTCHAGFAAGVKGAVKTDRLANVTQQVFAGSGRMVLAACAGHAQARELDDLQHGAFTYCVLRHWRDLDGLPADGCVTFSSLQDYVARALPELDEDLPQPVYHSRGSGRVVLRTVPR